MTSREALVMKKMPKSVIIVGAGAIGVEFAYFLNSFGSEVTLVEMLDDIVPVEDTEVSKALARSFKKSGMKIHTSTRVEDIEVQKTQVKAELVQGDKREKVTAESLLLSVGVVPNTDGLFSNKVNIKLDDRGYVDVNERYETSAKQVFAAGDIIGPPWLAHVATWEALQAVNGMFGHGSPRRVKEFPGCTYCVPQIASVGLTERAVKEKGLEYKVGKFPFTASGKAIASGHGEGFVKIITEATYGEILGAHIIGHDATELIAEYALAMRNEITADDIHATIHAHPTLSEALMEAAADSVGEAIHI
jgi:dihydrolipoamide dehydrogenase